MNILSRFQLDTLFAHSLLCLLSWRYETSAWDKKPINQFHAKGALKYSDIFSQNKWEFNSNKSHTHFAHQKGSKQSCEGTEIIYAWTVLFSALVPSSSTHVATFRQWLAISNPFSLQCLPPEHRRMHYTCPAWQELVNVITPGTLPSLPRAHLVDNASISATLQQSPSVRLTLITCSSLTNTDRIPACAYMLVWMRASAGNQLLAP